MTRVGVVGTGRMGSAMARTLARAGHELVLHNRTAATARRVADEIGGSVAEEPADVVREASVVIVMLADRAAVEETFRRPGGLLAGVGDGSIVIDMSTVEPDVSRALEPEVRAGGGSLLDAPVSGSVSLAESGRLTIMAGGDRAALERATPVLDALAARIFHLGPVGTGAAMKLAVNAVIFALDVGVAEALVLAERSGIEPRLAYDVLEASAVGAPFVAYKRGAFLEPHTEPPAFSLDLAAKDLRLINTLAGSLGVDAAQARVNLEAIAAACDAGDGDRDLAWVAERLRQRDGADSRLAAEGGSARRR